MHFIIRQRTYVCFPTSIMRSTCNLWTWVYVDKETACLKYAYKFKGCIVYMLSYCSSRPESQLFEGQQQEEEEQHQLNREPADDIVKRQLINNLAKHVLFSKNLTTSQPVVLLHPYHSSDSQHWFPTPMPLSAKCDLALFILSLLIWLKYWTTYNALWGLSL